MARRHVRGHESRRGSSGGELRAVLTRSSTIRRRWVRWGPEVQGWWSGEGVSFRRLGNEFVKCWTLSVIRERWPPLNSSLCYVKMELCFRATQTERVSVTGFQIRPVTRSLRTDQSLYPLRPHIGRWNKDKGHKHTQTIIIRTICPQKYWIIEVDW